MLYTHHIKQFITTTGFQRDLCATYQVFGMPLGSAPVVLVNHALTGNSTVTGKNGWWNRLIGPDKVINTRTFTIIAIDIPGNGYDGKEQNLIKHYKEFHVRDIALIQLEVLGALGVDSLFAVIGGSLGGQLAWELAFVSPDLITHLIPIATDWKATDWVIAQTKVQEQILSNSLAPIKDARMHAMTFYRTAASFKKKFARRRQDKQEFEIESWLSYHGKKLQERYSLSTYKLMNHLLGTADCARDVSSNLEIFLNIKARVHLVAIDTDSLFLAEEIYDTYVELVRLGKPAIYSEIKSIHGHDAFLIEYEQLATILEPVFKKQLCHK